MDVGASSSVLVSRERINTDDIDIDVGNCNTLKIQETL